MTVPREEQLIAQMKFKPELRLAIAPNKLGYEQWLKHEKLDVTWIADIYLYDNRERTYICSTTPSVWGEYITSCYDFKSLRDRKGRDYGDESLESWFESELDDANREMGSDYFPCFEYSVLLWDAALGRTECKWEAHVESDTTYKELWEQTKETLFEVIQSWGRAELLDYFPKEVLAKVTA